MQNWEVVKKKISEMEKHEFISNMQERSGPWLLGILRMNGKYNNKLGNMCVEDGKGCEKYKDCNGCKKHFLEAEYQEWIVHRTLRTQNKEVYIGVDNKNTNRLWGASGPFETTYNKDRANKYDFDRAIHLRDEFNKDRVGKQYLWVISKVEE